MAKKNLNLAVVPELWNEEESKTDEMIQWLDTEWLEVMPAVCDKPVPKQDLDILGERIKGIVFSKKIFTEEEKLFVNSTIARIKQNDGESADALIDLSDFLSSHFKGEERIQRLVRLNKGIIETFDRIMYIYAVAYMSLKLLEQNLADIPLPTMMNENGEIIPIPLFANN